MRDFTLSPVSSRLKIAVFRGKEPVICLFEGRIECSKPLCKAWVEGAHPIRPRIGHPAPGETLLPVMNHLLLSVVLSVTVANASSAQLLGTGQLEKETSRLRYQKIANHAPSRTPARPNIVLILGDDMGVNLTGTYAEAATPPCTPALDNLAGNGCCFATLGPIPFVRRLERQS